MLPTLVVQQALDKELDIIAIADHNSCGNARAFAAAARGTGLTVLPAMEVTSREEVHVLALFEDPAAAEEWQAVVHEHLPPLKNDEHAFGVQLVVDERDEIVRIEERLLLSATDFSLTTLVSTVTDAGGLAVPAHVDRPSFSVLSQLGFLPPELEVPAIEVSRRTKPADARQLSPTLAAMPVLQSSDAHSLAEIGTVCTCFQMQAPTLAEIRMALQGVAGRCICGYA